MTQTHPPHAGSLAWHRWLRHVRNVDRWREDVCSRGRGGSRHGRGDEQTAWHALQQSGAFVPCLRVLPPPTGRGIARGNNIGVSPRCGDAVRVVGSQVCTAQRAGCATLHVAVMWAGGSIASCRVTLSTKSFTRPHLGRRVAGSRVGRGPGACQECLGDPGRAPARRQQSCARCHRRPPGRRPPARCQTSAPHP